MNIVNALILVDDAITTVACTFPKGKKRCNYLVTRELAATIKKGDELMVEYDADGVTRDHLVTTVFAQAVHKTPRVDVDSNIEYKWVRAKLLDVRKLKAELEERGEALAEKRREAVRERIKEQLTTSDFLLEGSLPAE